MARRRGTYTLSSNIELEAGAPLDSRDIVQTKADLTNGSFPYAYVGMETYVISEGKKYRFIGEDPTDIEDWEEVGSASSDLEFIEISEADYAELTTEEKNDPTKIYFRYEATGFFRDVQDDPNATAFQGTKIPTGRTVDSVVNDKLDDKADNEPTFTEASTRSNIASGESIPTILGKIKKFFTDLKDLAFIGKDGATSTKFLRGDGTWQEVPTSEGTVTGVKVNGTTKSPVEGIVDIGTLATQATNTTYTLSISGNSIVLTPSEGSATPITVPYATAAGKATTDADGNTISSTYFKNGVGNATDGTGNRLAPFKVVTENEYAALTTAQKNNGTIYFRTGANTPMRPVQDDGTATDLVSGNLPTGQTIKSYLNANNNIVPISETDYAALTPAQKSNGKAYFRYEAKGAMRHIQDSGTATDLTSGDLPTGQTIKSYLNSNLGILDNGGNHFYRADVDFDTITKSGMYLNVHDVSNRPISTNHWFILIVFTPYRDVNGIISIQIAIDATTNIMYYRTNSGTQWSAWKTITAS